MFNMGLTSIKYHSQRKIDLFGRTDLQLISSKKANFEFSYNFLQVLGQIILYMSKHIFKSLPTLLKGAFSTDDEFELKYLKLFAEQLGLVSEEEISDFKVPAVSIIVNDDLKPHCDSMNPSDEHRDVAFVYTTMMQVSSINDLKVQKELSHVFKDGVIPLCIILYNRKCLLDLSTKLKRIADYSDIKGRDNIIFPKVLEIFQSSYSDVDYVNNFFTSLPQRRLMVERFSLKKGSIFSYPKLSLSESPDKMRYWSSVLHMFFLYIHKFGLYAEDVYNYVLFFSHQCTTTVTLICAMTFICEHEDIKPSCLYLKLAKVCCSLRNKTFTEDSSDTGSGEDPRFSTSNNKVYSQDYIHQCIITLNDLFTRHTGKMKLTYKHDIETKLCIHNDLKNVIANDNNCFKGIKGVRSNHLICLSSLLGLIPVDFYIHVPLHLDGGTGNCTRSLLSILYQ